MVASWEPGAAGLALRVVPSFAEVAADLAGAAGTWWRWTCRSACPTAPAPDVRRRSPAPAGTDGGRRCSPPRCGPCSAAGTYAEALAASRAASGVGLSRQAWNLVPKIREVEAAARAVGADRLAEVHPELAFAAMAGAPLPHPKRSPAGRAERRAALAPAACPAVGRTAVGPPGPARPPTTWPTRCALAWSARRLRRAAASGWAATIDATGLPMAISW